MIKGIRMVDLKCRTTANGFVFGGAFRVRSPWNRSQ